MNIYIGITGLSGVGKDSVADILTDIAKTYGLPVHRYRLSDEIKAELARRGGDATASSREILIKIGNELRKSHGGGVLASRTITRYNQEAARLESNRSGLVIAIGIRHPGEVKTFRTEWGKNGQFILVAVEASQDSRFYRKVSRGQYMEDTSLCEKIERADSDIGILACIRLADRRIQNNDTQDTLRATVKGFFDYSIGPVLMPPQTCKSIQT